MKTLWKVISVLTLAAWTSAQAYATPVLAVSHSVVSPGGSVSVVWNGGPGAYACYVYLTDATRTDYLVWAPNPVATGTIDGIVSTTSLRMLCLDNTGAYLSPQPTASITVNPNPTPGPKLRPIAVTASSTWGAHSASNVSDGNASTAWISGNFPGQWGQWIELDFGRTVGAWKIRLLVHQNPSGPTTHHVYAGQHQNTLRLVTTFSGDTAHGQWLEFSGDSLAFGGTRYVRVETTASPSWVGWSEIEVHQGVEHFGPFASAWDGIGTGDHTQEVVAWGSNATWITTGDVGTLVGKLTTARNAGAKGFVLLSPWLFGAGVAAHPDWQSQLANVASAIKSAGHADTIAAFFLLDEPYHNATLGGQSTAAMRDWLASMAAAVRAEFPTTPVGVILAVSEIQADVSMFDWVGFDCYGPWEGCDSGTMRDHIDTLRFRLTGSQRMIAVPEAFRWNGPPDPVTEGVLIDRMNRWHAEVLFDGKYVAVLPFLWPSHDLNNPPNGVLETGLRDMASVKERVYQFATELINPHPRRIFPTNYYASATWDWTTLPFAATNRNPGDGWISGGPAPAEIVFELGGNTRISRIELLTSQNPSGHTVHQLHGRGAAGAWSHLGTFSGVTADSQWLTWIGTADIDAVRVTTETSPSWVAWREVQIYRSP